MAPRPSPTCARGHSELVRGTRVNGRRGACEACARLHRAFAGIIPASPDEWPDLFRPGNEELFIRWRRLPRHHKLLLGGPERARAADVETVLARLGL